MKSRYVLLFGLAVAILLPLSARADLTGVPYGGIVTGVIPCTCSGGLWINFNPFFTGLDIPSPEGALYYPPGALVYAFFQIGVPGTYELGNYLPGPGACFVIAPIPTDPCIFIPALGSIEYTGTSSLAPISLWSDLF